MSHLKKDIVSAGRRTLRFLIGENSSSRTELLNWLKDYEAVTEADYSSTLYKEENFTEEVLPSYSDETTEVDARIILRDNFDTIFSKRPETLIFGEDAGEIGDVNQGLEGLQKKIWGLQGFRYRDP